MLISKMQQLFFYDCLYIYMHICVFDINGRLVLSQYQLTMDMLDHKLNITATNFVKNKYSLMNLKIGGRYVVVEKIGHGKNQNMQIYKAIDIKNTNDRYVAIKQLFISKIRNQPIMSEQEKKLNLKYIDQQDKIMRKFQHPNLLQWIGTYKNQDFKLIVTKYCNSGTLFEMITNYGSLDLNHAINILKQLCQGIAALHMQGVIHRDIKPDNIFIHNGRYIIGDFGLSKVMDQGSNNLNTICGTRYTQAPQVITGRYKMNADIYSLGVIFYIMLFPNKNVSIDSRGMLAKSMEKVELTLKNNQQAPIQVINFLQKCLKKDPKQRISWKDLLNDPIFSIIDPKIVSVCCIKTNLKQIQPNELQKKQQLMQTRHSAKIHSQYQIQLQPQPSSSQNSQYIELTQNPNPSVIIHQSHEPTQQIPFDQLLQSVHTQQVHSLQQELDTNSSKYMDQQTQIYERLSFFHLHVKQAQFIYENIIMPIERDAMLDLGNKWNVQFMFLVAYRCFVYMSYTKDQAYRLPFHMFNQEIHYFLKDQIGTLYQKCKNKFQYYSKKLTEMENEFYQIVKLRAKKIFTNKGKEDSTEDIFFQGIQGLNYTKQDQIQRIQKKIDKITALNCKDEKKVSHLLVCLKAFKQINQITLQKLKGKQFQTLVDQYLYNYY